MILGLDASTTTVGYSFYDGTDILDAGFIDISKLSTNKEKSYHVMDYLDELPYAITEIHLESALSGFMMGRTSQQIIIKLIRFNAIFEYILSEHYDAPIYLIGAMTARKSVFGKARIQGMDPKTFVKSHLSNIFDLTKFDKKNKIGNWDKRNADMYDAIVISAARYEKQ
jgi:hypothetical protein